MSAPVFHIMIPIRYHSSRLPGKALKKIGDQTLIERVYRQALKTHAASVTIATDDVGIADLMRGLGASVVMTSAHHASGTERLAEAVTILGLPDDALIVNVQGDEPFIPPALIHQVADELAQSALPMATLCWPLHHEEDFINPNVVKVVRDRHDQALYFSRSPIPAHRDKAVAGHVFRHVGLYAYRAGFLKASVTWAVCELESIEMLEQLRVLFEGHRILVKEACVAPQQDINTAEDLVYAQRVLMSSC